MSAPAPDTLPRPTHWSDQAICSDLPADVMSPADGDTAGIDTARGICGNCPVRDQCLDAALTEEGRRKIEIRDGVRGGLTPAERHTEYRRRRRPKPTPQEPAERPECGSRRAFDYHRRHGEDPCRKCRDAVNNDARAKRRARFLAKWCGTPTGLRGHLRRGETPCTACAATNPAHSTPPRKAAA